MNEKSKILPLFSIGMAMFSMFFGAGNIVFPLIVGQLTTDHTFYALVGLVLTAVALPFAGIFASMMYNSDYWQFFSRMGKWPGFVIVTIIMALIGPFGAMPRCVALSFSTTKMFFDQISIVPFSLCCCLLIYLASVKKTRVIDFVGWVLSPFFLLAIGLIVVMGLINHPEMMEPSSYGVFDSFSYGLTSGYQTMDLLGSFFFSTVVVSSLRSISMSNGSLDQKRLMKNTAISIFIGSFLLAAVYVSMSWVAALHSSALVGVPKEVLLGTIAVRVLGTYGGITTCLAVVLACLTTAMALASIVAEFFQTTICKKRISYNSALIGTIAVTFLISTLEFSGILMLLAPIVKVLYPCILVLSIVNIAHKLWGFDSVKFPVVGTFGMSLLASM